MNVYRFNNVANTARSSPLTWRIAMDLKYWKILFGVLMLLIAAWDSAVLVFLVSVWR